ncbi:MAG TPA: hypothetical protein VK202_03135 [Bacteroidia bacterium]|nr:hypothetical protein [Bacteroidia bacterium]
MTYILNQEDRNPSMRYEGLARYAFDCGKHGGPDNIANHSRYDSFFIPVTNEKGLWALNQILDALITKGTKRLEFIELKNSLSEGMKQRTAIELIDYIIKILNDE